MYLKHFSNLKKHVTQIFLKVLPVISIEIFFLKHQNVTVH